LSAIDRAAIPGHAVDDLVAQVEALHRSAIAGVDDALDRVAFDAATGRLAFADLKDARQYPSRRSLAFAHRRDLDRCALNARFGLSLWTEASVRAALADLRAAILDAWDTDYAPIDFGMGLSVGTFAKTDSGTGRWDCFNGPVLAPLVAGKRVIDLGCNNGAMPIMMLRSGAVEVVGVERNPDLARAARLVCEIAAWRDVAPYRFEIRQDDMRVFASGACGRFDVVTAYCSLYYLPHDQMVEVARVARAMHAQLVLQGNTAFGGDGTAEGLAAVMREAGYRDPSIVRFKGFGRPLVIGDRNL
jgi:SAM-dependent methyltransferase